MRYEVTASVLTAEAKLEARVRLEVDALTEEAAIDLAFDQLEKQYPGKYYSAGLKELG